VSSSSIDIAYPVLVTRRADGFELRIQELLVIVFATNLNDGWRLVLERKQQVIDCATEAGLLDQVTAPGALRPLAGADVLRWT
jgi:hypothetical protein